MDEASKGLRTRELAVTKVDGPDGFWSSSTSELDHSAAHSQRSISSIGKSNNPSDPQSSGSSQSGPPEFVNHGKFAPICSLSVGSLLWKHSCLIVHRVTQVLALFCYCFNIEKC